MQAATTLCATTPSNDTAVVYEAGIFYKCLTAALVVPSPCRTHGSELSAAAFCDSQCPPCLSHYSATKLYVVPVRVTV